MTDRERRLYRAERVRTAQHLSSDPFHNRATERAYWRNLRRSMKLGGPGLGFTRNYKSKRARQKAVSGR